MSTADHVTCCCAETLADIERLTQERDDARDTACRLEAELACPGYLTDLDAMPDPTPINARDLADELLTLPPVDPAHCNPRRKAHPVIGGRELECSECWRERVTERLEQWRRDIVSSRPGPLKPAQAPSVGLDAPHPGATAPVAPSPATPRPQSRRKPAHPAGSPSSTARATPQPRAIGSTAQRATPAV